MTKSEKALLSFIDRHLLQIALAAFTVAAFLIRFSLRDHYSHDYNYCLAPWYQEIAASGLSQQVGNYNFVYQFLIWCLTKLPVYPLYAYKLLSCVFDLVLASAVAQILRETLSFSEGSSRWKIALGYCLTLCAPTVFLNSALWAQCDSIYTAFALLALLYLERGRYNRSFVFLGLSFAFKLQAVFILPVFLFVYFSRRRFSIVRFLTIPAVMMLVSSPMVFFGRRLTDIFKIYFRQTDEYFSMSLNYPSVWDLVCLSGSDVQYLTLKNAAILLTVLALAGLMLWWFLASYPPDAGNLIIMAFLLAFTCVLFLPAMHERYSYLYEILAIILAVLFPRMIPVCAALCGISLVTYGACQFGISYNPQVLACINLIVYGLSIYILSRELKSAPSPEAPSVRS